MKKLWFAVFIILLATCNTSSKKNTITSNETEEEKVDFFPVTEYLKGQLAEIKTNGVNPIKYTIMGNKKDSVWLKMDELETAFAEYLSPVIDSAAMAPYFKESKFLDQTVGAFTFTYEPLKDIPASILLKRWDVYVGQESQKVDRIYIEKLTPDNKRIQLIWQAKGKSKMVIISTDAAGEPKIEKEEVIKWNFDDEEL